MFFVDHLFQRNVVKVISSFCSSFISHMSSNGELKEDFQQINTKIVANVNAATVVDHLCQESVITAADYDDLTEYNLSRTTQVRRLIKFDSSTSQQ